jgi:hypothetical protein
MAEESDTGGRKIVRLGEEFDTGVSVMVNGERRVLKASASRRGELKMPSPYRAIMNFGLFSRTQISVCVAADDQRIAPLSMLAPRGSAIGMISLDSDPATIEALKRPEVRRSDDVVAIVRIVRGLEPSASPPGGGGFYPLSDPQAAAVMAANSWMGCSPYGFHTIAPDGECVFVAIDDFVSVRIQWDRRTERAIVDLGRNVRAEIDALGWGSVTEDGGATRTSLEEFVSSRSPQLRRGPNVNQALARQFLPYRRTKDDIDHVRDALEVTERKLAGDDGQDVELVEVSMCFDDETRQRIYGVAVSPSRSRRVRLASSTMPLPFDRVSTSVSIPREKLRRMFREGKVEEVGSEANLICRELAIATIRKMDTLALRIVAAIFSECRGDRMEWLEDHSRICELLGESDRGKQRQRIAERIEALKMVELKLTLEADNTILAARNTPLFQYGGSVEMNHRGKVVWNVHPLIVQWMNLGGRFTYFDPRALRLGDKSTEWEFRVYLVLCDRWAAGWVTNRADPERAEEISSKALLDAASVDWRSTYGYAVGDDGKAGPKRMSELDKRFRRMVDVLIDCGLVQFAEPISESDDPAKTKWRFVAPVEHRDTLEANSSKRLKAAGRGDRRADKRRLEGRSSPDGAASG